MPIFAWNIPLVSLIFLKRSLVFPILLISFIFCIDHWGRRSYLSMLFFGALHSKGYIFYFLLCFSLLFFPQLFVSPPQTAILVFFAFIFLWDGFCFGLCTMLWISAHCSSGICLSDLILWIYCCTHYASIFGKLSSGHRTGKGQFSFQSKRKAMPKNSTAAQFYSYYMLAK